MTAFLIVESSVKDQGKYGQYLQKVPETILRFGGRYLARRNQAVPVLGDWNPERMIHLEFPSPEHISRWLSSPEYQSIKKFREEGADSRAVIVEGEIDSFPGRSSNHDSHPFSEILDSPPRSSRIIPCRQSARRPAFFFHWNT